MPVPRAGRERRGHPGRDRRRGARDADARLARSCAPARRRTSLDAALSIAGAGRARDRQRAPLPAAEGLLGHDAALAAPRSAARRSPGSRSASVYESSARLDVGGDVYDFLALDDGRLAVVLGDVTGHGDRRGRRHGDGEVRLPLARARAPAAGRLPRVGERGRRRRDRDRQVHHDGLRPPRRRTGGVACAIAGHPRAAARPPGRRRDAALDGARASRSGSTPADLRRGAAPVRARRRASFSTRTASSRRAAGRSCTASSGWTRCSRRARALRARSSPLAVLADCRAFGGGELADDCAIVVIKRTQSVIRRGYTPHVRRLALPVVVCPGLPRRRGPLGVRRRRDRHRHDEHVHGHDRDHDDEHDHHHRYDHHWAGSAHHDRARRPRRRRRRRRYERSGGEGRDPERGEPADRRQGRQAQLPFLARRDRRRPADQGCGQARARGRAGQRGPARDRSSARV